MNKPRDYIELIFNSSYNNVWDIHAYQTNLATFDILIIFDKISMIIPIHIAKQFCKELMSVLIA
jgi:hypothetical protein